MYADLDPQSDVHAEIGISSKQAFIQLTMPARMEVTGRICKARDYRKPTNRDAGYGPP